MSTENQPNPQDPAQVDEPDPSQSKAMKALKVAVPLVALLAAGMWFYSRNRISTDDAQVDGHLVPIGSRVYGSVEQVLVQDNQPVKAGELLLRIDPRDTEAKVAQAELESARTEVELAQSTVGLADEALVQARHRFEAGVSNNIELVNAQDEVARAHDNRISALYRLNQSRADLAKAMGQLESLFVQ